MSMMMDCAVIDDNASAAAARGRHHMAGVV
jgi:hypothetical protein